jgi:hypothetical protein
VAQTVTPTAATAGSSTATAKIADLIEWGPVFAGALAAAAISFVLYSFGSTIGLSLVSPWPNSGLPPRLVAALAVFWVVASQIGSFLIGGYVAGRLRSHSSDIPSHEADFRDGVHGLLVWALGVVIGAALLMATAASLVRGAAELGSRATSAAPSTASPDPLGYYADVLLRQRSASPGAAPPSAPTTVGDSREEVVRVLQRGMVSGKVSDADKSYLALLVSQRSGLTPPEAQKRVDETLAEAGRATRETADTARRGAVLSGLVTAVSLLVALAAAWWAAQRGGYHRDKSIDATLFGARTRPTAHHR